MPSRTLFAQVLRHYRNTLARRLHGRERNIKALLCTLRHFRLTPSDLSHPLYNK
jgi:hypothetical protein